MARKNRDENSKCCPSWRQSKGRRARRRNIGATGNAPRPSQEEHGWRYPPNAPATERPSAPEWQIPEPSLNRSWSYAEQTQEAPQEQPTYVPHPIDFGLPPDTIQYRWENPDSVQYPPAPQQQHHQDQQTQQQQQQPEPASDATSIAASYTTAPESQNQHEQQQQEQQPPQGSGCHYYPYY
ncbi:hypothetical protein B0T21DRAFT_350297 [Apiosordaria backusii]|uniref:Uncharacterized protein n=1 Tax=Apiosordaria backusii TaxID=314023 RepID=A0AA40EBK6_9PEZI|nr:hypothetical protein B0T21DRAFT_350297 [Apiosordaria backusii]